MLASTAVNLDVYGSLFLAFKVKLLIRVKGLAFFKPQCLYCYFEIDILYEGCGS